MKAKQIKYLISILFLSFSWITPILAQSNSKLASGNWFKIPIYESGFYKIDYEWLQSQKINPSSINPKQVGLYTQGNKSLPQKNNLTRPIDLPSHAAQFIGENDNKWDKEDYLLFYAENTHAKSWNQEKNQVETSIHPYSDTTYYFLRIDDPSAERIKSKILKQGKSPFWDFGYYDFHYEPELTNLIQSGREWLGDSFAANTEKKISYNLPDYKTGFPAQLYGKLANGSINPGEFSFQIVGNSIPSIQINAINNSKYDVKANVKDFEAEVFPQLSNNNWELTLKFNAINGTGYMDHLNLVYPKIYNAKSTLVNYWLPNQSDSTFSIKINNLDNKHQIWHFENGKDWFRFENPIENPEITSQKNSQLFIFDPANAKKPNSISKVVNQNIRNISPPTLLIISSESLLPIAKKYADFKNTKHANYSTAVSTTQIFQEFSGGKQDITAIRDFVKHLKNQPNSDLRYLLILGDASHDFKGRNSVSSEKEKLAMVPTYESIESYHPLLSYCSDDYFGILGEEGGEMSEGEDTKNETINIGIGRIPARTVEEANMFINKLISYQRPQKDSALQPYTFSWIADDGDNNLHVQDAEDFSQILNSKNENFPTKKVFLDQYPQQVNNGFYTSKSAQKESLELFNSKADFIHFIGHGAETGWTDEKIVTINELLNLKNSDHLPILLTATCQFGRFDNANQMSGAEVALLSNQGGAIALISTSRPVFQSSNYVFGKKFYQNINDHLHDPNYKLGDLFKDTKNESQAGVINRNIVLLGDPSLELPWTYTPAEITSSSISPQSAEKFIGKIPYETTINGIGEISIYQLPVPQKTLGTKTPVYQYDTEGKLLYKSRISIKNGAFQLDQKTLPILNEQNTLVRFNGILDDGKKVLGSKRIQIVQRERVNDNTSPVINYELLNESNLKNSGKNPILKINISDNLGISFWGPNGEQAEILLNDTLKIAAIEHFMNEVDRSDKGVIVYPFKNLPNGQYTISLKCWDINFNVAEKSFQFIVNEENTPLKAISVYPNPTSEILNFDLETEDNWTDYDYSIILFNLSGQKIYENNLSSNSNDTGHLTFQLMINELQNTFSDHVLIYSVTIINRLNRSKYQYNGKIGVIR